MDAYNSENETTHRGKDDLRSDYNSLTVYPNTSGDFLRDTNTPLIRVEEVSCGEEEVGLASGAFLVTWLTLGE